MKTSGRCVCCEESRLIDPEDGHCGPCGRGQCDHDDEGDDFDLDAYEAGREEYEDERWLDERGL